VNDSPRVKEEAHLFFQMRFLEVDDDRSNLDGVGFKKIGVKNNVMLCELFGEVEVKEVVW